MTIFRKHIGLIRKPGKKGIKAIAPLFSAMILISSFFSACDYIAENICILFLFDILRLLSNSFLTTLIIKSTAYIWQCGCGLDTPTISPFIFKDQNGFYGFMPVKKDHFITQCPDKPSPLYQPDII